MKTDVLLAWLLRLEAAILFLAIPFVFLPFDWMAAIHARLGLGELPRGQIVEYLTRSISALYATWAPLHLALATDVRRYASLICYFALVKGIFGAAMVGIDLAVGMPAYWIALEGPTIVAFAAVQWWLGRRVINGPPSD